MFKRFTKDELTSSALLKSSAQRAIRTRLIEDYPKIDVESVWPKGSDAAMSSIKLPDRVVVYCLNKNLPIVWTYEEKLIPTLQFIHQFPDALPRLTMDKGALRHILGGANIMVPGLLSKGAQLPDENLPAGTLVSVYVEGKESAAVVGKLMMSIDAMKKDRKGMGVEVWSCLGDELYNLSAPIYV